jgi:exonuclease III
MQRFTALPFAKSRIRPQNVFDEEERTMRIATWNCCRGSLAKKFPLLNRFSPDIAVIQECSKPQQENDQCLWFGDNPRQGIAIVARDPYRLRPLPHFSDVPKYAVPIEIVSQDPFILLAIWSKGRQKYSYVEAVVRAVEIYRDVLATAPSVVIGDFNSNAIWDDDYSSESSHSALVAKLAGIGMVSCYHEYFKLPHGREQHPTHYFRWNEKTPYHIDYAFVPQKWSHKIKRVTVGSYKEWKDSSDHRPLILEMED